MKEAGEELRKFLCRLMYTEEGREHLQKVAQNLSQLYPDDQDDSGAGVDDEAQEGERESALEAQDMRDLENEREKMDCRAKKNYHQGSRETTAEGPSETGLSHLCQKVRMHLESCR